MRVALIGYGVGGAVFHAPLIAATPGLELAAVVTRDPDRADAVRARYPGCEVVDDAERLWRDDAAFDLVVVAAPNDAHVPLALAAIRAGLPVVVDKPLAITPADGERLIAAAEEAGVPLTVFHNRRFDGDLLTVQRLLAAGDLGRVHRFESRFERWRPAPRPGAWREAEPATSGGGLLLDLGSHLVDQAIVLFGRPHRVYAEVDVRREGVRGDDDVFVALEHPDGVRSHLWASAVAAQLGPRFRVLGARAAYVKHGLDGQEDALRDGAVPDAPGFGTDPPETFGHLHGDPDGASVVPTERGDYRRFYVLLEAALRGAGPLPVDAADAVEVLRVLEAAAASAASGEVVALDRPAG
jgi:scyllo-inositol 2-dehydrogenase (NADP+)